MSNGFYRTQFHIGQSWGVHETTVGRIVRKVEDILVRTQTVRLPGKKRLLHPLSSIACYWWMGLNEQLNGQKKQQLFYSGKQKRHTLKAQVVVDYLSGLIVCTAFGKGRTHDFRFFKEDQMEFGPDQMCLVGRG